jgi:acetyl-CoA carboxylase carboxyl transferase subunit alpha
MWRDATKKELAAQALRITASDLQQLGCIDGIIPEPEGGAHADHEKAAALVGDALLRHLAELKSMVLQELLEARYQKFRHMAQFYAQAVAAD